jgi:hypothetical protein
VGSPTLHSDRSPFTDDEVRDVARFVEGDMKGCVEQICAELLAARARIAELERMQDELLDRLEARVKHLEMGE